MLAVLGVLAGLVAGLLDGRDTVVNIDVTGQLHVGGVGGEIDSRLHARQRVELLLDAGRTRCAGHTFEVKVH